MSLRYIQEHVEEQGPPFPWFGSHDEDSDDVAALFASRSDQASSPDAATILVIDDDLANLALSEAMLQAEGFRVRVAMDATSAFAVLTTTTPALILMDIQLPEVDGWELTRALKNDPATKDIPVIAITAYGKPGDQTKARKAGFVEFLSKPVSTRELPAIIRRHLPTR